MQAISDADRSAIAAVTQAAMDAFNAADWAAAPTIYTEDAIVMPPNAPLIRGRNAIEAFLAKFPPISNFTIANTEVEGVGDLAYVVGTYSMTITPEGAEPITDTGKFLEIRKKQADGSWPLYVDIFNSDLPASTSPPVE
jgi:uncharacterized protein (TIGR02246 family)